MPRGGPFLLASSLDLLGYGRFAGKENVPRSLSYQFVKDALARTIEQEGPESIAAFIATPIIGGTVGAITPPPDYFARICEICDDYDVLLIMDEVITGFGRLGINFGIDHWQISPDIITVAKSLSSGYAAHGAVIVHKKIWVTFADGKRKRITLLSTFASHPISCAASLAVQEYIACHKLIDQCAHWGAYLKARLEDLAADEPTIGDVRGKGLFLGIEFVQDRETRQPFPRSTQLMEKIVYAASQRGAIISGRFGIGIGPTAITSPCRRHLLSPNRSATN